MGRIVIHEKHNSYMEDDRIPEWLTNLTDKQLQIFKKEIVFFSHNSSRADKDNYYIIIDSDKIEIIPASQYKGEE